MSRVTFDPPVKLGSQEAVAANNRDMQARVAAADTSKLRGYVVAFLHDSDDGGFAVDVESSGGDIERAAMLQSIIEHARGGPNGN